MSYFNYKGKKVHYEVHGEGKPLILLNGIMMSTKSWDVFKGEFSLRNQLVLIDFLDQGQSDKMEGTNYTQVDQVEMLKAFFDEMNYSKISLVGISYGGEVALEFAVKYQEYIDKMALFNTSSRTSPWLRDLGFGWNESIDNPLDYYYTTIPIIYSPEFYNGKNEWMNKRREFLTNHVFNQKSFMDSMYRLTVSAETHDVTDQLDKIKIPTLIVSCDTDFITPMSEQRLLNERISTSDLVILPTTGHASMYERPVLFAALVLGFINLEQNEFNIG